MPKPVPDLIGSKEACQILGKDRATLSRWVATGRLVPAVQLPGPTGAFLFHRNDVEALVEDVAS